MKKVLKSLLTVVFCCVASPTVQAQTYELIDIGTLPGYAEVTIPYAITETGRVVGKAIDGQGNARAFLWQPAQSNGYPAGMSDLGVWQGFFDQRTVGISRDHWTWHNRLSDVAGQNGGVPVHRAMLWDGQNPVVEIPPMGQGIHTGSRAVSSAGYAGGWSETGAQDTFGNPVIEAFVRLPNATVVPLGFLANYAHSEALGINNSGLAVGWAFNADGAIFGDLTYLEPACDEQIAVRFGQSGPVNLNNHVVQANGWTLTSAWAVNDEQVILCSGVSANGRRGAVVLVPTIGDFNGDGELTGADATGFSNAFASADLKADAVEDGIIDAFDGAAFTNAYSAGILTNAPSFGLSTAADPCDEAALLLTVHVYYDTAPACLDCKAWNQQFPGRYHSTCNRKCFGCDGDDPDNPHKPDGAPGWPGDDSKYEHLSPFWPDGGPGGDGDYEGDGGDGGDGGEGGDGGAGGKGGGALDGPAGDGGKGGDGGAGGKGGDGGDGGDGGGSGEGGTGGAGGNGGDAGPGQKDGNDGGDGGKGGNGGTQEGDGGRGGRGGDGGDGKPALLGPGGDGGQGGNGGDGGDAPSPTGEGGDGGAGGTGGSPAGGGGGPGDQGGGGDGGHGGTGTISDGGGGDGGAGDPPGSGGGGNPPGSP